MRKKVWIPPASQVELTSPDYEGSTVRYLTDGFDDFAAAIKEGRFIGQRVHTLSHIVTMNLPAALASNITLRSWMLLRGLTIIPLALDCPNENTSRPLFV